MITKKNFYKLVSNKNNYTKEEIVEILKHRIDEFNDFYFNIQFSDNYDNVEKQYYSFYYNIIIRELEYLIEEVF